MPNNVFFGTALAPIFVVLRNGGKKNGKAGNHIKKRTKSNQKRPYRFAKKIELQNRNDKKVWD